MQIFKYLESSLLCLFCAISIHLARCKYLFGSNPQGGLWGGQLRVQDGRQLSDRISAGFPQRGYVFDTISYDPISEKALLEIVDENGDFHGLATGLLCDTSQHKMPEILIERVRLVDANNPHLAGCGPDCGWSAFAMFDSRIYFLFLGQYGQYAQDLVRRVELRVLEGCEAMLPMRGDDPIMGYGRWRDFPIL